MRQALRKKQEHFVFHWRGGGLNQEILGQLLEKCAGAAAERGKTVGLLPEPGAGGDPDGFLRRPGRRGAGGGAGRGTEAVNG